MLPSAKSVLPSNPPVGAIPRPRADIVLHPQWEGPRTALRHTWEGIINVDQFRWFVRRDLQEHLALAHRELGARHVRAVGMFDDELRVFCPSPESFLGTASKEPRTNWQIVDYAMDSLVDLGLSPLFTTSFVPSAMAAGPTTVFTTKGYTCPPRDWRQWENFVRESVSHAVDRYSLDVVRQWYFEAWNEPNLHGWFWGGTKDDFMRFWQVTHHAIKSVDASLRVGGPSTGRADWLAEFVEFSRKHDCPADYLITHIYNNDSSVGDALAPFDGPQEDKSSKSPNFATGVMRGVRTLVNDLGFKGELHWNEWGRFYHAVEPRREDASEAAFIVRLLDRASQEADVFSYWCLSDIYDQVGYGREAFHGGYGLLSLQGLRKPAYHAFQLLGRLGVERVPVTAQGLDDMHGAITTWDGHQGQVLVHAYQHDVVPSRRPVGVTVELPAQPGTVGLYRIDHDENNVVTQWRALGAPAYLSRAQRAELAAGNQLQRSSSPVSVETAGGRTFAHFQLESPGVALLEFTSRHTP